MAQETITGQRRRRSQPDDNDGGGGAHQRHHHHYKDSLKIFVSRIPVHFDEDSIRRLVQEKLQDANDNKDDENNHNDKEVVLAVELAYPNEKTSGNNDNHDNDGHHQERDEEKFKKKHKPSNNRTTSDKDNNDHDVEQQQQHKGYGFVVLKDTALVQKALTLGKLRGGAKPTSSRQNYTLYIGPCLTDAEKEKAAQSSAGAAVATATGNSNFNSKSNSSNNINTNQKQPCFLWTSSGNKHCPYGAACKFQHVGGDSTTCSTRDAAAADEKKKKKVKCRDYRKNKCKLGDACPFSHDFEPKKSKKQQNDNDNDEKPKNKKEDSEKDCISWKTKGKCRKFHKSVDNITSPKKSSLSASLSSSSCCPYRHDPQVQKAALDKMAERKNKKRQHEHEQHSNDNVKMMNSSKRQRRQQETKVKQPLSIRVFGMSYDTTRADVQRAFAPCGKITKIDFPVFDDASRRSKGYCGVTFCTHKAVEKAVRELDGHQEKERWWRVQAGSMLLDQWEA